MVDFEYKARYDVNDFRDIIRLLRGENGCPWDMEQTHESIRRNLLEEAYEVCEAIDDADTEHLKEELGDLMMQVLFHSRIEEEAGSFDIDDVADAAVKKLIRRHPHIFNGAVAEDSAQVLENWDEIKRRERNVDTTAESMKNVAKSLPSLWRAEKIQKQAKKVGFDWLMIDSVVDKLQEELAELKSALINGTGIEEELGDLIFSAVNVARFVGVDPEEAVHAACDKFVRRFAFIEEEAARRGQKTQDMNLEQLEALYQIGKQNED